MINPAWSATFSLQQQINTLSIEEKIQTHIVKSLLLDEQEFLR